MLRQVLVPSKENSTISIPAEFYGMEVEVVVHPLHFAKKNAELEAYGNLLKFRGTLKRDIDCKSERDSYLDEKYNSAN